MPDAAYWSGLYTDYVVASARAFGHTVGKMALLLAMSVAEHETNNGRAWPHTNNFGAVQLRSCNADELARIKAGTLKAGDTFPGNPGGVLHIDTHPVKGGSIPYPVWFVCFGDDRVAGIAYFLKILWRLSGSCLDNAATCNVKDLCDRMYARHYFEGFFPDDKPFQAVRALPLDAVEQRTADQYAGAVASCLKTIGVAVGLPLPDPMAAPASPDPVRTEAPVPAIQEHDTLVAHPTQSAWLDVLVNAVRHWLGLN